MKNDIRSALGLGTGKPALKSGILIHIFRWDFTNERVYLVHSQGNLAPISDAHIADFHPISKEKSLQFIIIVLEGTIFSPW